MKHEWTQARREQAFQNSGARFEEPRRFPIFAFVLLVTAITIGVLIYG